MDKLLLAHKRVELSRLLDSLDTAESFEAATISSSIATLVTEIAEDEGDQSPDQSTGSDIHDR